MGNPLPSTEWGWQFQNGILTPVETDIPVGPDTLLNMVSCGFKSHGCGNMTCSCKKLGLFCASMCTNCIGQSCNNIAPALDVSDEDTQETVQDIIVKDILPDDEDGDD